MIPPVIPIKPAAAGKPATWSLSWINTAKAPAISPLSPGI
jgi:hypothetical protein